MQITTAKRSLVALFLGVVLLAGAQPATATHSTVTAVKGSAYGYRLVVNLFGGPNNTRGVGQTACTGTNTPPGCTPTPAASYSPLVTLPTGGGNVSEADTDGVSGQVGPAVFFSAARQDVSTQGTLGPDGSVTSSSTLTTINTSESETFGEYDPAKPRTSLSSTCTAPANGAPTGSTTVTNGLLQLDNGYDANGDGDYGIDLNGDGDYTDPGDVPDPGEHPPVTVIVPTNPAPNTTYEGHIEVNGSQDYWRYVFNEQIVNADGSLTVYGAHQYILGPTAVGDLWLAKSECGTTKAAAGHTARVADFDGDAKTDIGVYRPSTGVSYLRRTTAGDTSTQFGATGDVPVPGDYDGDAKTDIAIFRPSTNVWYLRRSTAGDTSTQFGAANDVVVPADYDGDGKTDVAVFRPSTGVWYLRRSALGDTSTQFGATGDVPVPGDYDGDAKADVAIFRPSTNVWYLRRSSLGDTSTQFGAANDVPVPGDYDGDAKTDVGVFRPSTGVWYLRRSNLGDTSTQFGATGDMPQPGDYDGDAKTDVAIYRPGTNVWYLRRSTAGDTSTSFGAAGDIPLALPAAIRQAYF